MDIFPNFCICEIQAWSKDFPAQCCRGRTRRSLSARGPSACKFLCSWRTQWSGRAPGRRSEDVATQNLFWFLLGMEWMYSRGLVRILGRKKTSREVPLRFSKDAIANMNSFWPTCTSEFQGQELCSRLKNLHASGLFCDNTPPLTSTSQIYCGPRFCKCISSSSLTQPPTRAFSWAQWVIRFPLGKQKTENIPSYPQYQHLFPTFTWSLKDCLVF